jgi:uncharacterized phage protein (TIGR01671 family)
MNNRIIKFRAWDKLAKYMVYPNSHMSMDLSGNVYNLQNGAGGTDYELMQSTGIKDKNGKEIYEGDICRTFNDKMMGLVEFNGNFESYSQYIGFKFKCHQTDGNPFLNSFSNAIYQSFGRASDYYEVIGNIFENPELLK